MSIAGQLNPVCQAIRKVLHEQIGMATMTMDWHSADAQQSNGRCSHSPDASLQVSWVYGFGSADSPCTLTCACFRLLSFRGHHRATIHSRKIYSESVEGTAQPSHLAFQ